MYFSFAGALELAQNLKLCLVKFSCYTVLPILPNLVILCRYNIFTGCPLSKTCTLILRGGAEQFIEETERSLHDAIMIVRRTIKNDAIVAGMCIGKLR